MHVSLSRCGQAGRQALRPTGDIDLATADTLRVALITTLSDETVDDLLVDLSDVTFLDCAGVAALLEGRRDAVRRSKAYDVDGAHGSVLRVLELTGVRPYLRHQPDHGADGSGSRGQLRAVAPSTAAWSMKRLAGWVGS